MYFVRLNTKIWVHKLAIRCYKTYEEPQLGKAGTIFGRFDKKRGNSGDFFVALTQLFLVRQFWTSSS